MRSLKSHISRHALIYGSLPALAALIYLFRPILFGDFYLATRDVYRVHYPVRAFIARTLASGAFPDWFSYDAFGQSLPASFVVAFFHPSILLHLFLATGTAIDVTIVGSIVLAFLGMLLLGRALGLSHTATLVGAMVFAFSGYLLSITNNLNYLLALSTLPLLFASAWPTFRRPTLGRIARTALLHALLLFCGDPQTFYVASGLMVVIAILARPLSEPGLQACASTPIRYRLRAPLVALVVLGFGTILAAVQLLPSLSLSHFVAIAHADYDTQTLWSVHPLRLLEIPLGPLFRGWRPSIGGDLGALALFVHQDDFWVYSISLGLPASLLALFALAYPLPLKTRLTLAAAIGLLLLTSLGRHTPVYRWLYLFAPYWKVFRYPTKLVGILTFVLSCAAGVGTDALRRNERLVPLYCLGLGLVGLPMLALPYLPSILHHGLAFLAGLGYPTPLSPTELANTFVPTAAHSATTTGFFALLLAILLLWRRHWRDRAVIFVLVVTANGAILNGASLSFTSGAILRTIPDNVRTILARPDAPAPGRARYFNGLQSSMFRVFAGVSYQDGYAATHRAALSEDTNYFWNVESGRAYLPAMSYRHQRLFAGVPLSPRIMRLFGINSASVGPTRDPPPPAAQPYVIARMPNLAFYDIAFSETYPRTYLAHPICVSDLDAALAWLRRPDPLPLRPTIAAVECSKDDSIPFALPYETPARSLSPVTGTVRIRSYEPGVVRLEAKAREPSLLVLNDAYYPGWQATVDGRPTKIFAVNALVQGVVLSPGAHEIVFRYRTPGLIPGAWVTGSSGLFAFFLFAGPWRRRPLFQVLALEDQERRQ